MSRINDFLRKSNSEYRKYVKTGDLDYLAQAGEKLWLVFNLLIEKLTGKKIRSHKMMKKELMNLNDKYLWQTHDNAFRLHQFFYGGWTEDPEDESNLYLDTLTRIETIMRKSTAI